jgi:hypothetical protein
MPVHVQLHEHFIYLHAFTGYNVKIQELVLDYMHFEKGESVLSCMLPFFALSPVNACIYM